jgi:hypothetical protein
MSRWMWEKGRNNQTDGNCMDYYKEQCIRFKAYLGGCKRMTQGRKVPETREEYAKAGDERQS